MKFSIKHSIRWSIFISIVTFALAMIFTVASTALLEGVSWGIGMLVVVFLVATGIIFDVMGLSAAAASEIPFHGMAAERVKGSKRAIYIVRNADRFSNFCNDVVGDVCSVISGAATAAVVLKLMSAGDSEVLRVAVSIIFTATVSALTVGGKAMGKSFAIHFANDIVLVIGRFFDFLEKRFKIKLFTPKKKSKNHNGKRGNKRARTNQPA